MFCFVYMAMPCSTPGSSVYTAWRSWWNTRKKCVHRNSSIGVPSGLLAEEVMQTLTSPSGYLKSYHRPTHPPSITPFHSSSSFLLPASDLSLQRVCLFQLSAAQVAALSCKYSDSRLRTWVTIYKSSRCGDLSLFVTIILVQCMNTCHRATCCMSPMYICCWPSSPVLSPPCRQGVRAA